MIFLFKRLTLTNVMKNNTFLMICAVNLFLTSLVSTSSGFAAESNAKATKLVEQAEQQTMGNSLKANVSMSIVRAGSTRDLKFRLWQFKRDKALVKISEPLKDRDTGSLRLGINLWQYLPNIGRVVRIPPSMMLQSWMGSDFTNDDLIKTSSLARDYTHQLDGDDKLRGDKVSKVLCMPKPDAPVVWGKVRLWIRSKDGVSLRQEFFSEHGELLKVMDGSDIKKFGTHTIATTLTMTVAKKEDQKTTMHFADAVFDQPIDEHIFTQENLTHTGGEK